ncbi:hypothetical protein [Gracilimonas sp.]
MTDIAQLKIMGLIIGNTMNPKQVLRLLFLQTKKSSDSQKVVQQN